MLTFNEDKHIEKAIRDLDWFILFSSRTFMKAETKIWFCFYYTQFWKLNYFPSHHHINIMYTQYHLQSLKARGLVHSLVLQRHLGVTSDYYHLWEQRPSHCSDTFVRPDFSVWTLEYVEGKFQETETKNRTIHKKAVVCQLCGMMIKNIRRFQAMFTHTHTHHHYSIFSF